MKNTDAKEVLERWFRQICLGFNEYKEMPTLTAFLAHREDNLELELVGFRAPEAFDSEEGKSGLMFFFQSMFTAEKSQLPKEMVEAGLTKIVGGVIVAETWITTARKDKDGAFVPTEEDRKSALMMSFLGAQGRNFGWMASIDDDKRHINVDDIVAMDDVIAPQLAEHQTEHTSPKPN